MRHSWRKTSNYSKYVTSGSNYVHALKMRLKVLCSKFLLQQQPVVLRKKVLRKGTTVVAESTQQLLVVVVI